MKAALFEEITKFTPKRKKSHAKRYDSNKSEPIFDVNVNLFKWNHIIFLCLLILVYFLFIARSISVQISSRDKYLSLADKNRIREFSIFPGRGVIYDRNGEVIVRNKPSFSIEVNTLICSQGDSSYSCGEVIDRVGDYVELDNRDRIYSELDQQKTNIILATGVPKQEILILESNIGNMPGLSIETAPARDYLFGSSYAHLVGYIGFGEEDNAPVIVGKTGIEEAYNKYLSGVPGGKIVQVDSVGSSYRLITSRNPLPGKDITLNIDIGLQNKAYELLKNKVEDEKEQATGGAIVAQDPIDGSILALVSFPSFDPNKMSSGISSIELNNLNSDTRKPFFNRAISAAYPPGSVFKLVTASAILTENIADIYDTIVDNGFVQVGSFIYRNWNTAGEGQVNLIKALQKSNDTYFYIMGGGYGGAGGLGIEKLHKWALKFGFNKLTGIDINGEVSGYMPDGTGREWYQGDDFISAIGQGDIQVTPIQINNMMTYFANGGYLYEPKVVKSIDGESTPRPKIIAEKMLSEEDYDAIRKGIHAAVVSGGTGYPVFDFYNRHGIMLAGKTGTSEFISPDGEDKTHAVFTIFGPYKDDEYQQEFGVTENDKPIVLTVFLEGGGGGSDDAAPIANELLDYWFADF